MTGWGTPRDIAIYVGRPVETIRKWAKTGAVPTACELGTRKVVVHAGQTRAYADTRGRRLRAAVA